MQLKLLQYISQCLTCTQKRTAELADHKSEINEGNWRENVDNNVNNIFRVCEGSPVSAVYGKKE